MAGRAGDPRRLAAAGAALLLAAASAMAMALLYHPCFDPTRVYDGSDTRAFGLLFGAAFAFVWPSRSRPRQRRAPRAVDAAGAVGWS